MTEILQERIYPEIPNNVYSVILSMTSDNDKPNAKTKWVCQQVVDKKIQSLDDGEEDYDLKDLLYSYDKYKSKLKPIMDYKDRFELEDDIANIRNDGYQTKSELIAKARKGAKKVYNDNDFTVYHILNVEACRRYGSNTTWCLTARAGDESFNHYKEYSNGEIYFIIDKKNKNNKYACVKDCLYDEFDELILIVSKSNKQLEKHIESDVLTSMELAWRIHDNKKLKDVIPYGFPTFDKDDVEKSIKYIYKKEMGKDLD
jgi:hypothetical protein